MIPRVQFEVYLGEEADGLAVGVEPTFQRARLVAEEGVKATGKTHAIVKVLRHVEGIVRMPQSDTP